MMSTPGLPAATGMAILPQYQGDYYKLQNQQALAQALMGQSLQNQASQIPSNMAVMPKFNPLAGIAQLGQALLAGKEQNNVSQGYANLGQQQMAALMGTPAPPQPSSSTETSDPSTLGTALSGTPVPQAIPVSGSPAPQAQSAQGGFQGGMLAPGGSLNPSGLPVGQAAMLYMQLGPTEYSKQFVAPYAAPTPQTLAARQAGLSVPAVNAATVNKDLSIPLRPGEGLYNAGTGHTMTTPSAAPAGYQNIQGADGRWYTVQVGGGPQAVAGSAAAATGGAGTALPAPTQYDAQGNPLPTMSRTAAVTGQAGATTPGQQAIVSTESGGNPGAVSPKGAIGAWQLMPNTATNPGFGVTPAQNNSPAELDRVGKDYYTAMTNRYSSPTIGAIAYNMGPTATDKWLQAGGKFESLSQETRNYVGKVATLTALNSGAGAPQGSTMAQTAPSSGANYPAPPLAAQANATATAQGAVDTMQKSYQNLQGVRANGPAALQDLGNMATAAPGALPTTVGPYGSDLAALFSNDAKTYAKSRDHLVSTLGTQLGMNTDAGRAFVAGAIPEYGAPREALQKGLANIQGQVQANMLKSDFLSTPYVSGNAKTYNTAENQFDQNITPNLANIIAMPAGPARATALSTAAKDPTLRPRLEWAANNGVLK